MNSTLFYWYFYLSSDCWHLTNKEVFSFPIECEDINSEQSRKLLIELMADLKTNSVRYKRKSKNSGSQEFDSFYPAKSKFIIDRIDTVLAQHYGFTEEELDFIINYDIKYRMGNELEAYVEGTLGKDTE